MPPETVAQSSPLVSVICRSIGRPELQQALQSVCAQTYPNLEIVLIDAKGTGLSEATEYVAPRSLLLVANERQYSRSQAANAGLDAANGDYLMFLDDDDWIVPEHIQLLVSQLESNPANKAAYSNTQKTDQSGALLDSVFDTDFDPVLLMRDNFIPIHALLFHRSLLQHGARFDETFDIYEDWDFWLQLSQHTAFSHVDKITAYYREGGDSETAAVDTHSRYNADSLLGKGRAAIFNKWLPRWDGNQVNQLIGSLDKSAQLQQFADDLHTLRLDLDKALAAQHGIQSKLDHANLLLADKTREVADLKQHIANQQQQVKELSTNLDTIYASISWKLMGPFRRAARLVHSWFDRSHHDKQ